MKKVILDCDNTMGITDCDVDDGLALIYLLGCPNIELLGITTTYGNNRIDVVYPTTQQVLREIGREDIPLRKGGASKDEPISEASHYLVEMARRYSGELTILATGSLTNLKGAYMEDPVFFDNVAEIVLMGGITSPLVFEKKVMDELNFSCDSEATFHVLTKGRNVSIATGNNCLKVLFTKEEYKNALRQQDNAMARYILEKTDYYFRYNEEDYGIHGFYNWDVTAAVYVAYPELFEDCVDRYALRIEDLQTGFLRKAEIPAEATGGACVGNATLNLPKVLDAKAFKENIYQCWLANPVKVL